MKNNVELNKSTPLSFFKKFSIGRFLGDSKGILLVFVSLLLIIFFLTDVLKINNESGRSIFLTQGNMFNVINQVSYTAIMAFVMTLVIIIGGIDLSVASIVAASGVVSAILLVKLGLPVYAVVPLTLLFGLGIGFANGIIVAKMRIPAFVITLASMTIFRGLGLIMVDGKPIFIDDPSFKFIGNGFVFGVIPIPVIILAIVFAAFHFLMTSTVFGRYTYALGGNEEAARLSGINVDRIKVWIFMLMGMVSALSGLILAARLGSGQPNVANGDELSVIASAVVGGTSMSGGVGTIFGTLIGALIIGLINNGMNLLGVSAYFQPVVRGLIILLAVMLDKNNRK